MHFLSRKAVEFICLSLNLNYFQNIDNIKLFIYVLRYCFMIFTSYKFYFFYACLSVVFFFQSEKIICNNTATINYSLHISIKKIINFFINFEKINEDTYNLSGNDNDNESLPKIDFPEDPKNIEKIMQEKFVTEMHWNERICLENHFSYEYKNNHTSFLKKIKKWKKQNSSYDRNTTQSLVNQMILIKYDAIMNTLRIMKESPNDTEKFGVFFNTIFDLIRDNNFSFDVFLRDQKFAILLLNKIVTITKESEQEFIKTGTISQFESIFLKYGMTKEKENEWNLLFDQYRYDYYKRCILQKQKDLEIEAIFLESMNIADSQ